MNQAEHHMTLVADTGAVPGHLWLRSEFLPWQTRWRYHRGVKSAGPHRAAGEGPGDRVDASACERPVRRSRGLSRQ